MLPVDGTHCPRCGLRVAALPRRRRPREDGEPARRRPRLAEDAGRAGLQGAAAGAVAVAVAALAGAVTALAGGPGRAVTGDACLAAAGLLVLAAVVIPGLHIARWAETEVMRSRAAAAHRIDPRRAFVLAAAAICVAGLIAAAAVPS
jgi:hypothetical protein